MTTIAAPVVKPSPVRDEYRFGDGPSPALRPGTMGWSVADVEDPGVYRLWVQGRYEILNGVLTVMPPAFFHGGTVADNLKFILRDHLKGRSIAFVSSSEVDVRVRDDRVVRADGVVIFGDDLPKFRALRFPPPRTDWREHVLTIPPTLVIESVSRGHEVHDRVTKRRWYAEFGVRHYWVVDGFARTLECLLLDGGAYRDDGSGRGAEVVRPASLEGLVIPLPEVWGDGTAAEDRG